MSYRLSAACAGLTAALLAVPLAQSPINPTSDALLRAIQRGSLNDVERALADGASPNAIDGTGATALMLATLYGEARLVDVLLRRGADPNGTDAAGATALMWAVSDPQKVRMLIAAGANVNARSKSGRTPLLAASAFPRTVPAMQLLLEKGADVRAKDQAGNDALVLAVRGSDLEGIEFLVSRGLDVKTLSPGATRTAALRNDQRIATYLVERGLSLTPEMVMVASMWQTPAQVKRWIDAGGDVNATGPAAQYSRTALLTAATSEGAGPETLRVLLQHGANVNARTTEGETALDWAVYKGDREKIAVLEQHGATRGDGPRREDVPPATRDRANDLRQAVSAAVSLLVDVAPTFRAQTGCISCHHNAMPAIAAGFARRKGIEVDRDKVTKNVDDLATFFAGTSSRVMLGDTAVGGEALTVGYALMALREQGYAADMMTAALTHWLLARQMADGRWLGNGINRPPSEYSTVSHTAIAAGGLRTHPLEGRRRETDAALKRAAQWLGAAATRSAEERGMRLMGLVWAGAPRDRVVDAIAQIRRAQEESGGWSQFGRTPADAYATGLSLHALHVAGVSTQDPTYRKGLSFLLETQYQSGAWLVRTHSFPTQRYFESGFPFARHQWISAAGTSWAAMAISHALPSPSTK